MAALHTAGIGSTLTLNKLVVFLKKIPPVVNRNQVTACGVTPQEYKAAFDEKDSKITADIQETVMVAHPQREEVELIFYHESKNMINIFKCLAKNFNKVQCIWKVGNKIWFAYMIEDLINTTICPIVIIVEEIFSNDTNQWERK